MKEFGFDKLPLGMIVGEVELINVKRYKNEKEHKKDKNKHLANSFWGKYGLVLINPKRIKPFSAKGNLNFWNLKIFK